MRTVLLTIATILAGCGNDLDNCRVACTADTECPNGQTCGDVGRCTSGELCTEGTCEASAFLGCADDETARFCNADGAGAASDPCGGFGCDAEAARCNDCRPDQTACAGDDVTVCTGEGLIASAETCALSCDDDEARCHHIVPLWIPTVCDTPVADPMEQTVSGVIDTGLDQICTEVIAQVDGPEICVFRGSTITLAGVTVIGRRAIAFVADGTLRVEGTLDLAATLSRSGPGGGFAQSAGGSKLGGGGGAGGRQLGGAGGGLNGSGGTAGLIDDPLSTPVFRGGERGNGTSNGNAAIGEYSAQGGGGGGGALLISCTSTVTVSGKIDAGGGGGLGGGRVVQDQQSPFVGGAGGGAGGYVVLQGAQVEVTGKLFANGGGGGGGTSGANGNPGKDGAVDGIGGQGGVQTGTAAAGGAGGQGLVVPDSGVTATQNGQSGGGGGSTGRFQVYVPNGVTPLLTPLVAEPPLEPVLEVPTN